MRHNLFKFIALLIWFFAANAVSAHLASQLFSLPSAGSSPPPFVLLGMVAAIETGALIWLTRSLRTSRLRAVIIVTVCYHFAKYALMLVEALFFLNIWNAPALISAEQVLGLELMGVLVSLLFCPPLVCLFHQTGNDDAGKRNNGVDVFGYTHAKLVCAAMTYAVCFLLAGIAILIPLAGGSYHSSYANLQVPIWMPLFEVARGLVWALLLLCLLRSFRSTQHTGFKAGALFALLGAAQLLVPNQFMSMPLQLAHIVELVVSMLVFGVLGAKIFAKK